jgi:hypothetical protein
MDGASDDRSLDRKSFCGFLITAIHKRSSNRLQHWPYIAGCGVSHCAERQVCCTLKGLTLGDSQLVAASFMP